MAVSWEQSDGTTVTHEARAIDVGVLLLLLTVDKCEFWQSLWSWR